jgi:hypothetical protein
MARVVCRHTLLQVHPTSGAPQASQLSPVRFHSTARRQVSRESVRREPGTILDTGRDLFEWVIDWFWPLNWDFLMTAPTEDVQRLNGEYFAYYLLNANYVIGGLVILGLAKLSIITLQPWLLVIIAIITAILFLEAALLRKEIRAIVGIGLPHESVYARLGKSLIQMASE